MFQLGFIIELIKSHLPLFKTFQTMLLQAYASGSLYPLAVDPPGIIAAEKGGNASYVIGLGDPAQRSNPSNIGPHFR
jgi:hypothetical protein